MAYVPVPKDLTKVKTKVMFNLTRRQLVCFTLSLIHISPYRFPHTAAVGLFAEQVAVCAGAGQRQHQNIIFYAVDKQPVRENMTFPMACPIAGQVMVTVLILSLIHI